MNKFLGLERNTNYDIEIGTDTISVNPINLMPISNIIVTTDMI